MIHPRNILRMIKAGDADRLLHELARNGRPALLLLLPALDDPDERNLLALALGLLRCRELTYRLDPAALELLRQVPERLAQTRLHHPEATRLIADALHALVRSVPPGDPLTGRLESTLARFHSVAAA